MIGDLRRRARRICVQFVGAEAIEEPAVLEAVLIEDMVRDAAVDEELTDRDRFRARQPLGHREFKICNWEFGGTPTEDPQVSGLRLAENPETA